jgi:cell division protein FtsN
MIHYPKTWGRMPIWNPIFRRFPKMRLRGKERGRAASRRALPPPEIAFPEISETPADTYDREADRKPATDLPEIAVDTDGRYLVIAGSFRQLANAEARVKALRRSGFAETTLEKFNRGTYAVALAGRSDRYSEAARIAERVRAAGFEARVMKRR